MRTIILLLLLPIIGWSQTQWIVDQNGGGDFKTIQDAFDKVPENNTKAIIIFVKSGVYYEKAHLDEGKDMVSLIGEDKYNTLITYNDHTGKIAPDGSTINTFSSQTIRLDGDDFTAKNISFENNAGFTAGQAVAVQANGDRMIFENCRFTGFQDILLTAPSDSRQYYKDCYIEGTTDFIFGAATVWFEKCHIHSKKKSHVTAASTPPEKQYGFIFNECVLTGDRDLKGVSLGRPWKEGAAVLYQHCYIGAHIKDEGFSGWNKTDKHLTARYREFQNYGPSGTTDQRLDWTKQLTDEESKMITLEKVFGDWKF